MAKRLIDMTPAERKAHDAEVQRRRELKAKRLERILAEHDAKMKEEKDWKAHANAIPLNSVPDAIDYLNTRRNKAVAEEIIRTANKLTADLRYAGYKNVASDICYNLRRVKELEGYNGAHYPATPSAST